VKAESAYGPASWIPLYKANAVNGLPVIDFGARGCNRGFNGSSSAEHHPYRFLDWSKIKAPPLAAVSCWASGYDLYGQFILPVREQRHACTATRSLFHDTRSSAGVRFGEIFHRWREGAPSPTFAKWDGRFYLGRDRTIRRPTRSRLTAQTGQLGRLGAG
jgi:hypothetical protein